MKKKVLSVVMAVALTALTLTANMCVFAEESLYAVNIKPYTPAQSVGEAVSRNSSSVEGDVATGDIIQKDGKEYIAVVCGDVNCDAKINSTDFIKVRYAYLNLANLSDVSKMAADVNGDGKINSTDFMMIRKNYLSGFALGKEGDISYGDGNETEISNRPVVYHTYDETLTAYPEEYLKLFGEMKRPPYLSNDGLPFEEAQCVGTTKNFTFEGTDYILEYDETLYLREFEEKVRLYKNKAKNFSILVNGKTGKVIRVTANYTALNIETATEEELKASANDLLQKYLGFNNDSSYAYEISTSYQEYTVNENGPITSEKKSASVYVPTTEKSDASS